MDIPNHLAVLAVNRCVQSAWYFSLPAGRRIGSVRGLVAAGVCALLAAGCGPAMPSPAAGQRSAPGPVPASSRAPADPGYQAARQQWIAEGLVVSGAGQNPPLDLAVRDLERGDLTDTSGTSGYPAAIAALRNFESLPLTGNTPAQLRRGDADVRKLGRFFGIPLVGPCGTASGPAARAAAAEWKAEPRDDTSGIRAEPLRHALADLVRQLHAHPAKTSCYPAAIADLSHLETATKADVAASAGEFNGRGGTEYGDDIAYLNDFFRALGGYNGNPSILTPDGA
jgi:hypothetical protein